MLEGGISALHQIRSLILGREGRWSLLTVQESKSVRSIAQEQNSIEEMLIGWILDAEEQEYLPSVGGVTRGKSNTSG